MIMMPNSETSDSNGYEDSLHMDPKDTRLVETAGREAQGREPAEGGVGSWPGGAPLAWDPMSVKPNTASLVDKEKLGPLLTCLSPSSTCVFTHDLLDFTFHLNPRITKTF